MASMLTLLIPAFAAPMPFGTPAAAADPSGLAWSTVATTGPPALTSPALAYDADDQTVVMFGGTQPDGTPSGQTWILAGTSWSQASGVSGPPARSGASMAFDAVQHQLILFGGTDGNGNPLGDTWAWNGAQWYQLAPSTSPPPRSQATLAPDPAGNLVLFAGTGDVSSPGVAGDGATPTTGVASASTPGALDDTWTWDGSTWAQATTATAPPARTDAMAAFDSAQSQTVLFGGESAPAGTSGATQLDDTWTWDGSSWTAGAPATTPGARSGAALVGDTTLGGAVLWGGSLGGSPASDTWTWDGSSWTSQSPTGDPPALAEVAGALDESTGQAIVYGGGSSATLALSQAAPAPAPSPAPTTSTTTAPTPGSVPAGATPTTPPPAAQQPSTTTPSTAAPLPRATTTIAPHATPAGAATPRHRQLAAPALPVPVVARSAHPGGQFVLRGSGFAPFALVQITFHSVSQPVTSVRADAEGAFSISVTVPESADIGSHHFVMSGRGRAGTVTTQETAVLVVALHLRAHPASLQTPIMVAVSVLLPALTWFGFGLLGRRRGGQRQVPSRS